MYKRSDIKGNLAQILKQKWDEAHAKDNVFRYKINQLMEKFVNSFLIQLNPERSTKRRPPEQIDAISQPFDVNKFNFNKVSPEEILFDITNDSIGKEVYTVIVNVSPISRYHSLLCPMRRSCLPQIVTEDSLKFAVQLMFDADDKALRIGFNSLCALASVNHLHYHLFFEQNPLPVETAKCHHISGPVFCLQEYPVPAFSFQIKSEELVENVSKSTFKLTEYLMKKDIAHNIFITKGLDFEKGVKEVVRIFVWPRKSSSGVKQLGAFNVAVLELSGWFPVYNENDFKKLKQEELESELVKWKIEDFDKLCNDIKYLYN